MNSKIEEVKVGGKIYPAQVDHKGVLRFVASKLVRHLVDSGQVDLNRLARDYADGKFSQVEYLDFHRGLGYSLDGFCDLSAFANLDVITKHWSRSAPKLCPKCCAAIIDRGLASAGPLCPPCASEVSR